MDIYDLIQQGRTSDSRSRRIVALIINNLNDRRGIKQELQGCDQGTIEEIFDTLTLIVEAQL